MVTGAARVGERDVNGSHWRGVVNYKKLCCPFVRRKKVVDKNQHITYRVYNLYHDSNMISSLECPELTFSTSRPLNSATYVVMST